MERERRLGVTGGAGKEKSGRQPLRGTTRAGRTDLKTVYNIAAALIINMTYYCHRSDICMVT